VIRFRLGLALWLTSLSALSYKSNAQNIKGVVKDSLNKPLPFATITLKEGPMILSYTETDSVGAFKVNVPAKPNLFIEAFLLGYKKQNQLIIGNTKNYEFILKEEITQLKAIVVKDNRPKVTLKGDTLSYNVSSFTNQQDKVIGDVIKKLPGVDVANDGKISYNGRAISNLYIDGDNLLDDKYNIATKSIPAGVVDDVQIIENDQPIKALRNKAISKNVALNLKIKATARFQVVGQETMGAGLPGNYFFDLNAMAFKKRYKAINYIDANNTSNDLQEGILSHNLTEYVNRTGHQKTEPLLSLGTVGNPNIPSDKYLFNKSKIFNFNNLFNLPDNRQLKANIYYLDDQVRPQYNSETILTLPDQTVRYYENQVSSITPKLLHAQTSFVDNKDQYYLKNTAQFDLSKKNSYAQLSNNMLGLQQRSQSQAFDISNELNYINTLKSKGILEAYGYIAATKTPEYRDISPGILPSLYNDGMPYQTLRQNGGISNLDAQAYLGYKLSPGIVKQSYKVGYVLKFQQLNSSIGRNDADANTLLPHVPSNNVEWRQQRGYAEANYSYLSGKLKAELIMPVNFTDIGFGESGNYKKERQWYFAPQGYLRFDLSDQDNFILTYRLDRNFGSVRDIYRENILIDYRTVQSNFGELSKSNVTSTGLGYSFKRPVELLFINLNLNFTRTNYSNLTTVFIDETLSRLETIPLPNVSEQYLAFTKVSKYIFNLHSTVGVNIAWQLDKRVQLQNNVLTLSRSYIPSFTLNVDTKVSKQMNFVYNGNFLIISTKLGEQDRLAPVKQFQQQASISYTPSDRLLYSLTSDYRYSKDASQEGYGYQFFDFAARYSFVKKRFDLELNITNLFDIKNYQAVSANINSIRTSNFRLPGRIVLMRAVFNL
jgi:hypothetical protein